MGMDLYKQTSNSSYFYHSERFLFSPDNFGSEQLYISSTACIGLSEWTGKKAQVNQCRNMPDPQFWVKSETEVNSVGEFLYKNKVRHSFDLPQDYSQKIDVIFPFEYSSNYKPQLLFDGPNKQKKVVHAQIDELNKRSIIYFIPAENQQISIEKEGKKFEGDLYKGSYTVSEVEAFKIKNIKGCITALTLLHDINKILYCVTHENDCSSSTSRSGEESIHESDLEKTYSVQKHTLYIESLEGNDAWQVTASVPLKKIICTKKNEYLGLSHQGDLYLFKRGTERCQLQKTKLKFKDIAIDAETKDMAFLDTNGKIYIADANKGSGLECIYTLDSIEKEFVERISYANKEILVIYGTSKDNKLLNGYAEKIMLSSYPWKKNIFIGCSIVATVGALGYLLYKNK